MTGVLTGGVRRDGQDVLAGTFVGAITAEGFRIGLDPGSSTEVRLIIGTASCLPDTSYVVPPGRYEAVAAIPFNQPSRPRTLRSQLVARGAWLTVDAV